MAIEAGRQSDLMGNLTGAAPTDDVGSANARARLRPLTFVGRVLKHERNTASTGRVKRRVRPG